MKKIVSALAILFDLVAMVAFSFCAYFHYNVLGFASAVGDAIGSALLLPVAIIAFLGAGLLALIFLLASLSCLKGKGKGWIFTLIILLLIQAAYVGYIWLSLSA